MYTNRLSLWHIIGENGIPQLTISCSPFSFSTVSLSCRIYRDTKLSFNHSLKCVIRQNINKVNGKFQQMVNQFYQSSCLSREIRLSLAKEKRPKHQCTQYTFDHGFLSSISTLSSPLLFPFARLIDFGFKQVSKKVSRDYLTAAVYVYLSCRSDARVQRRLGTRWYHFEIVQTRDRFPTAACEPQGARRGIRDCTRAPFPRIFRGESNLHERHESVILVRCALGSSEKDVGTQPPLVQVKEGMQLTRPSCDCRYYLGTTSFHRSINRPSCVNISSLADHSFTFVSHSPSSRFDTFLPSNRLWNRFLPPKPPHALLVIQLRVQSFRFDSDRVIVSRNRRRSSFIIDEINQTDEK